MKSRLILPVRSKLAVLPSVTTAMAKGAEDPALDRVLAIEGLNNPPGR